MEKGFEKRLRYFSSLPEIFGLILKNMVSVKDVIVIKKENKISRKFAEKIMLAVSGVNLCRNCSYLHTKTALEKDVDQEEIRALLEGVIEDFPKEEAVGIFYAQHWADTMGQVSKKARQEVSEYYGEQKTRDIEKHITAVSFGNLACNTVEAYRDGSLERKEKTKLLLPYLFCLPISGMIKLAGRLR